MTKNDVTWHQAWFEQKCHENGNLSICHIVNQSQVKLQSELSNTIPSNLRAFFRNLRIERVLQLTDLEHSISLKWLSGLKSYKNDSTIRSYREILKIRNYKKQVNFVFAIHSKFLKFKIVWATTRSKTHFISTDFISNISTATRCGKFQLLLRQ